MNNKFAGTSIEQIRAMKIAQNSSPPAQQNPVDDINIIEDLAHDLNESLEEFEPDINDMKDPEEEEHKPTAAETINKIFDCKKTKKGGWFSKIPKIIVEIILLLIIYIILSQNFVKRLIGEYIKQINPNEEGYVSQTGIFLYGLILAVLFVIVKKLIIR